MATLAQTSGFFFCSAILKCARTWRKLRTQKPTEDEVEDDNDGNDKMPKRDRTRSGSKNYFLVTALSLSFFLAFSLSPLSLLLDFSSHSFTFLFLSLFLVIFSLLLSCPLYFIFLVCFSFSYLSLSLTGLFLSLTCLFVSFLSLYLSFIFHAFLAFIFLLSAHLRSPCHNSPRVRSIPLCLYLFT